MKSIIKRFDSRKRFTCLRAGAVAALFAVGLAAAESEAYSRVVYSGLDSLRIVGRSLDWKTPIPTNIYVYPREWRSRVRTVRTRYAGRLSTGSVCCRL